MNEADEFLDYEEEEGEETEEEDEEDELDTPNRPKGNGKGQERSIRRKRLTNILKFTAELFNCGMIASGQIVQLADDFAQSIENIEFCCLLLRYAGRTLDVKLENAVRNKKIEPPFSHTLEVRIANF